MSTPGSESQPPFPTGPQGTGAVPQPPYPTPGAYGPPPGGQQPGYPGGASPAPTPPGYNPAGGYPQQPWNAPPTQPYPGPAQSYPPAYPTAYAAAPVPAKSPWLGRIALIVVAACTVIATVAMGPLADLMAQLMIATGSTTISSEDLVAAASMSAPGAMMAMQVATWVGMAAAITGLIAAILGRGRATGIFALVLGLLAPLIMVIYAVIVVFPLISQY
ncbi:MAG TPA: hypothetical protein DCM67_10775 [Propionibacteriaceae bacterium]|nr:hypothetical protein [Propionibacteriaceae bacterium]